MIILVYLGYGIKAFLFLLTQQLKLLASITLTRVTDKMFLGLCYIRNISEPQTGTETLLNF